MSDSGAILTTHDLGVKTSNGKELIRDVDLALFPNEVLGIIGPSGAGKSTLLKCMNRLIDLTPGLEVMGDIRFHGLSVYSRAVDPDGLRVKIGMLFQQPVVFPVTIYYNVLFGVRRLKMYSKAEQPEVAEQALREAALWDEVKDRLNESAAPLSVGQQQRLCLARTLAARPEIVLMDEPTSALDPKATEAIENLVVGLKKERSIVLVTHDMGQAERITNRVAEVQIRDGVGELA